MSNAISRLMWALVALGFLASTTMNMHRDIRRLEAENQKLSQELSQLRSSNETIVKEHDALKAENENLKYHFNTIQTAYLTENQARLKAEAELETYKSTVFNMANNSQPVSSAACLPGNQYAMNPGELLLSNLAPVGASSLVTLAVVCLVVVMNNYSRKQKKLRSLPEQIRNLRSMR